MRKKTLGLLTAVILSIALFLTFSTTSNGKVKPIKEASASQGLYKFQVTICPDLKTVVGSCNSGTDSTCTPDGACPGV